uniref:uncharacterized protein LOC131117065 n=1 Tax=Doryrhamphus excisus TaxID=161450 RepID=UPI0025ADECC6|nr:uncharacterized protein LOC131117065 [Doryrhamphus excisus]
MKYVNSWATEVEIQAAADSLGINIFTFYGGRWLRYSSTSESSRGIYLDNSSGNHYECVTCVNEGQLGSCFGICQNGTSQVSQYGTRSHRHQVICADSEVAVGLNDVVETGKEKHQSMVPRVSPSKYLKRKRALDNRCKYVADMSIRETKKVMTMKNYREQAVFRQRKKTRSVEKYRNDVIHKNRVKTSSIYKYRNDSLHRDRVKMCSVSKYRSDSLHRDRVKMCSVSKYRSDSLHRDRVKMCSVSKYRSDSLHRDRVKLCSVSKYRSDSLHRDRVKMYSASKYRSDSLHRARVIMQGVKKYKMDTRHRASVKLASMKKYHSNLERKMRVIADVKARRHAAKLREEEFDVVVENFLEKVKNGPQFVCCVCHRLMFKHQVLQCHREHYSKSASASLVNTCINEDYLHKCSAECTVPCLLLESGRGQLWVCYTCHYKISKGEFPPECVANNLGVDPIPPELACLNSLEQHLIALNIPFMKMLALPKGGQNGVHGPVTCVPANVVETTNLLPRSNMEGSMLRVKLKRKLTYKGHYEYHFVDSMHIREALRYLKESNVHYEDIEYNEEWVNDFCREPDASQVEDSVPAVDVTPPLDAEDELLHDRQQHCMFQDTCLMPVDIGQEALDQYYDNILNVAPAEGNNPVRLLSDHSNEAKCFPVLFPRGRFTFHDTRQYRLTASRYFNNRIMHADKRFGQNVEYIFYAQYLCELVQVVSSISIALRKGIAGLVAKMAKDLLTNDESLKTLLECDQGYRFLKPIRGTPAFWQSTQRDILACVRQLGVPTWFCSFSSADLRWQNLVDCVLRQEGRTQTAAELEWADRCDLLRRNPVTAARMFDFRWHVFLREVIMSSSQPIGKVVDYFYRVEFQQRGSPHVHCLFWVENAPRIEVNSDEEVTKFIDRYVTCELQPQDEGLTETVSSVQQHSKRHSKTCKKKNTVCRFGFPKPVSGRTFISHQFDGQGQKTCTCQVSQSTGVKTCTCPKASQNAVNMKAEEASEIIKSIKTALADENHAYQSVEHLFHSLGITQNTFEAAHRRLGRRTEVIMKRQINEVWINPYSKPLLKCWNANMDIQYVVDAYACVVYIISYISKAEREIGLLLSNAQKEASKQANVSAKEALKSLGSVYLHNRDVCAQEAVYRVTNMHLKECSRKVVFVPTGDNVVKMSLPVSVLRQKASSAELTTEDMWMTSIVDRYKNRPNDDTFNDMCLAQFASEYRIISKNERSASKIELKNNYGHVTKRTRTKPAVVRSARFSETKNPELYYRSLLQLYLPYRVDLQLRPANCPTFEEFYDNGAVRLNDGSMHSVRSIVETNKQHFDSDGDELDSIQRSIDHSGVAEDAWCLLCPEQELERLQCEEERRKKQQLVEEEAEVIPDLANENRTALNLQKQKSMSRNDGLALIRSLNNTQMDIFYKIRQWCLDKVGGRKPEPLHLFITGGAGTGKSHLIKAIQYEATRLLSTMCRQPDNISVCLAAPTGIAAYNLNATTIHSTLSIGKDTRLPYTPLGEETVNSLRAKFADLQILIIDEISMVDHKLLTYIHGRLRQIKQTGDYAAFGNVSIIAVGDFYQLPPVKGKPLYVEDATFNLWTNLFSVVELTTIVRQKDNQFAALLNRLRKHPKGAALLETDIELLKQRETGEVSSALHVFPTNQQVNEYNLKQLFRICPEYTTIKAEDFSQNKKSGKLERKVGHHSKVYNTCLEETLHIAKDARVMLCKNIDIDDGLVNGVSGTVSDVLFQKDDTFPSKIYIKFDDAKVGQQRRAQTAESVTLKDSTFILPEEEKVTKSGGMRRQFPLKLAWACTVHKVQGVTVSNVVVSLDRVFSAGQAYVALSRVTALDGLIIEKFNAEKIYCNDAIKNAVGRMPAFLTESEPTQTNVQPPHFTIYLMNVQNLTKHASDLAACTQHLQPNCIAVTETWLPTACTPSSVTIPGYHFHSQPRCLSYSSSNPALVELQGQQHGGVGMYIADHLHCSVVSAPNFNLEVLLVNCSSPSVLIAVVYRPPSYPMALFQGHLGTLLDWLHQKYASIVVLGDFNENLLKSSTISTFMARKGFCQSVKHPTTEKGTLIDHVYVKTSHFDVESVVMPTYFSDHEGILCSFKHKI